MANEQKELNSELYFCRYLDRRNWVQRARVAGHFVLICPLQGTATIEFNDKPYEVDGRTFLILHPHLESQITHMSEDFRACCIGSRMELQSSVTYNMSPTFLALVLQRPVWDMNEETAQAVHAFCTLFDYNCNQVKGANSANIATALLTILIQVFYEKVKHLLPSESDEGVSVITRNLLTRFMNELRLHYKDSHQVLYYADKVCVSPKYLTQVVKRHFGMTPKEIIDRKLAVESMYLLSESQMSIQEISNELNFPDQSYFGRFFRRMLGLSPMTFRQNPDFSLMARLKPISHGGTNNRWDFWDEQ